MPETPLNLKHRPFLHWTHKVHWQMEQAAAVGAWARYRQLYRKLRGSPNARRARLAGAAKGRAVFCQRCAEARALLPPPTPHDKRKVVHVVTLAMTSNKTVRVVSLMKAARLEKFKTLGAMARATGLNVTMLSKVEKGGAPLLGNALKIAEALGKTVEELWRLEGQQL